MIIANPIYDVVFKYLLDDNRVAKLFLGKILGEEIEELTYVPHELKVSRESRGFTVLRLDFAAKIRTESGDSKTVLIELQKAKFYTDIMRFRKYLGSQYADDNNSLDTPTPSGKRTYKKPLPIVTIYFLGHLLDHIRVPFIKVTREYSNGLTGEQITERESFIESLTHDCFVIQIPALNKCSRRDELEILLSLFDQRNEFENHHTLQIDDDNFPEKFKPVLRRLQKAYETSEVRQTMDAEDDIIEELTEMEREISLLAEEVAQKSAALAEKDSALAEKDSALAEKDSALADALKELERLKALL